MFVFRQEVSGPQQRLLQVLPGGVPGPLAQPRPEVFPLLLVPVVAALAVGGVGVLLGAPGAGDGALVGGGLARGGGGGDDPAASSV